MAQAWGACVCTPALRGALTTTFSVLLSHSHPESQQCAYSADRRWEPEAESLD